jgi:hypothetical protein
MILAGKLVQFLSARYHFFTRSYISSLSLAVENTLSKAEIVVYFHDRILVYLYNFRCVFPTLQFNYESLKRL